MILLFLAFVALGVLGMWLFAFAEVWRKIAREWPEWPWPRRASWLGAAAGVLFAPYLIFKAWELPQVFNRVPEPLEAMWIDYRLEDNFGGFGLPGDKETGFVVYRLTPGSARWARDRKAHLDRDMSGEPGTWHSTPIDDIAQRDLWHRHDDDRLGEPSPHQPDVREFLDRYGFSIPLAADWAGRFNHVIRNPGALYAYGRGGSVTVIDPKGGKVYFAYAG